MSNHGDARDGERKEILRLYEKNKHLLYNVAYGVLNNRADAEDAVQDAIIKILESPEKYICESDEISANRMLILLQINVRSRAIDIYRKNKKSLELYEDLYMITENREEVVVKDIPDVSLEPQNIIIREDEKQALRRALRQLKDLDFQIINLYFFAQYSHKEIAERLKTDPEIVRIRQNRALGKLKKIMEKEGYTHE